MNIIEYQTRDSSGKDIIREIAIKEFPTVHCEATCFNCKSHDRDEYVLTKSAVSANFTDWNIVGAHICPRCSALFSVFPYSYVFGAESGITLLNVRQIKSALVEDRAEDFKFCISTSQKKHLFYRAPWNKAASVYFSVQLETETILTSRRRQMRLFRFVELLLAAGCNKAELSEGMIRFDVLVSLNKSILDFLKKEVDQYREIQIPLFCAQKPDISKEEAINELQLYYG